MALGGIEVKRFKSTLLSFIFLLFLASSAVAQNGPVLSGGGGVKTDFSNVDDGIIPASKLQESGVIQPDAVRLSDGAADNLSLRFKSQAGTGWYMNNGLNTYVHNGNEQFYFTDAKLVLKYTPFQILPNRNDTWFYLAGGNGLNPSELIVNRLRS